MKPNLLLLALLTSAILTGCQSDTGSPITPDTVTPEDKLESDLNPSVFLAGNYSIDPPPNTASIIEVRRPAKITGAMSGVVSYTLTILPKGDSVNLALSGRGVAGTYTNYNLGNYIVIPFAGNPTGKPTYNNAGEAVGVASYGYRLLKSADEKAFDITRDLSRRRNTNYTLALRLFSDDNLTPTVRWRAFKKVYEVDLDYAWSAELTRKTTGYWR